MCLAQGHNAVTPVRQEQTTPRFQDKHSTTEPLPSHMYTDILAILQGRTSAIRSVHGSIYHRVLCGELQRLLHGFSVEGNEV